MNVGNNTGQKNSTQEPAKMKLPAVTRQRKHSVSTVTIQQNLKIKL